MGKKGRFLVTHRAWMCKMRTGEATVSYPAGVMSGLDAISTVICPFHRQMETRVTDESLYFVFPFAAMPLILSQILC